MSYQEILNQVSKDVGLPYEVVKEAYESFWRFIRGTIQSLPLKEDLTEEEFIKYRTNFNIPSLGKLHCTYDRISRLKKRYKYYLKLNNNDNSKED